MKPRHILMGVALAGAGALVLFGDKAPDNTVAEAVERRPARTAAAATCRMAPSFSQSSCSGTFHSWRKRRLEFSTVPL